MHGNGYRTQCGVCRLKKPDYRRFVEFVTDSNRRNDPNHSNRRNDPNHLTIVVATKEIDYASALLRAAIGQLQTGGRWVTLTAGCSREQYVDGLVKGIEGVRGELPEKEARAWLDKVATEPRTELGNCYQVKPMTVQEMASAISQQKGMIVREMSSDAHTLDPVFAQGALVLESRALSAAQEEFKAMGLQEPKAWLFPSEDATVIETSLRAFLSKHRPGPVPVTVIVLDVGGAF